MARQHRIEYPGAFYHVYSRGNQKQPIFLSDEDRHFFIKCLRDSFERFGCIFLCYCLMPNHYHLFLKTPSGHLSKIMHMINRAYATYFNRKYEGVGHIFQGRYKCILVEAEVYAQELSSYIHLNPVEAAIADLPQQFPWSNYRDYLGLRVPEPWTDVSFVLNLFSSDPAQARLRYADYVASKMRRGHSRALREAQRSGVMASPAFLERLKRGILAGALPVAAREPPQITRIKNKPELSIIMKATRLNLGTGNKMARNIAIFISHKNTDYTLKELADFFHVGISGVTDICRRMKKRLPSNTTLNRSVLEIERRLFG
jgi:putative transposase